MIILRSQDAIHARKPEGINVSYFLFDEYEIHFNEQAPGSIQTWHHHEVVWETLYLIEGELTAKWKENGIDKSEIIKAGDLVESENTPHTFINESKQVAKFLIFKQILDGKNKRDILKNDKIRD